jgi:hypothetical protein
MKDLPEAEKIALEKELEDEMAAARRRKLACFQKTSTGVIKKTVPAVTTTMTTAPMVTSNLTPEELVKLIDVPVASKYSTDLTQFTHIIADDSLPDEASHQILTCIPRHPPSVGFMAQSTNRSPLGFEAQIIKP